MTDEQKTTVKTSLNRIRRTWLDIPEYVRTDAYKTALTEWIGKHVANGREGIETLVLYALHHETGNKLPYFEFNRIKGDENKR